MEHLGKWPKARVPIGPKRTNMPIIWQTEQPKETQVAVWELSEELYILEELFPSNIIDLSRPEEFAHPQNHRQWLATRILLGMLLNDYHKVELYKTDFGKLMISNLNNIYISVSHTQTHAAVSVSNYNTGIDIETKLEKIDRIKHKFLNEQEKTWAATNPEDALMIWCSKECLYKLYEQKELDFIKHITIQKNDATFVGHIHKELYQKHFNLQHRHTHDYMLVWAIETII